MQNLARNTTQVFFKLYEGQTEILDEYGNKTGSFQKNYGEIQSAQLSVSPNRTDASLDPFGTLLDYDRTMTTADTSCPIDENSILWIDANPDTEPYNYFVRKRAPWKNSISFAVKKVEVNA